MNNEEIWVFAHISKTGGTSLRCHFAKHLDQGTTLIHMAKKGYKLIDEMGMTQFCERSVIDKLKTKVIIGHEVTASTIQKLPHHKIHSVVTFRDPRTWIVSRYNQRMNRRVTDGLDLISFQKWLESNDPFHSQFDWLYAQFFEFGSEYRNTPKAERIGYISSRLGIFTKLLILENLDVQMKPICSVLGIPSRMVRKNASGISKIDYFEDSLVNTKLITNFVADEMVLYEKILSLIQ